LERIHFEAGNNLIPSKIAITNYTSPIAKIPGDLGVKKAEN